MSDAMKTNEHCTPTEVRRHPAALLRRLGLRLMSLALVPLLTAAFVPLAAAAPPDGTYKFVKASGSITIGGDTTELTPKMIKELGIVNDAAIVVKNSKMRIDRNVMAKLLDKLETELGAEVETEISGPTSLTLRKTKKGWAGKTKRPVVVKFTITFQGETTSGNLNTHFNVKIVGRNLTLTTPVTGKALGQKLEAEAVSKFKR